MKYKTKGWNASNKFRFRKLRDLLVVRQSISAFNFEANRLPQEFLDRWREILNELRKFDADIMPWCYGARKRIKKENK
jgi:uncharacterized protein (DUF1786 family)